jgi:hypothetical protein
MSMRAKIGDAILGGCFLLGIWCAPANADGGSVLLSGKRDGYQITVFAAPTPFRAGPVDISVLVQDVSTGDPLTNVQVTVRMTKSGRLTLVYPATTEAATNKLLHAAKFQLPEPGRWDLEILVERFPKPAIIAGEVEAAEPLPQWQEMWPWIGWPVLVIAIFFLHHALERRSSVNSTKNLILHSFCH